MSSNLNAVLLLSIVALFFISTNLRYSSAQDCSRVTSDNLQNPCEIQSDSLTISYENVTVQCGERKPLTHYSGQQNPTVTYARAQTGKSYILAMVDPDAPSSAGTGTYFLHWLVSDIRGADFSQGHLGSAARILMAYYPPGPPPKTGVHAYQFFVFELSRSGAAIEAPSARAKFDLVPLVHAHGSCAPVAATQFRTRALEEVSA